MSDIEIPDNDPPPFRDHQSSVDDTAALKTSAAKLKDHLRVTNAQVVALDDGICDIRKERDQLKARVEELEVDCRAATCARDSYAKQLAVKTAQVEAWREAAEAWDFAFRIHPQPEVSAAAFRDAEVKLKIARALDKAEQC